MFGLTIVSEIVIGGVAINFRNAIFMYEYSM